MDKLKVILFTIINISQIQGQVCNSLQVQACEQTIGCGWIYSTAICEKCQDQTDLNCQNYEGCLTDEFNKCNNDQCSLETEREICIKQKLCGWNERLICASCRANVQQSTCTNLQGCVWEQNECLGDPCRLETGSLTCHKRKGCGYYENTCQSCLIQSEINQCNIGSGCFWKNSECINDYCSSFESRDLCLINKSCGWSFDNYCVSCSTQPIEIDCNSIVGCLYRNNFCSSDDLCRIFNTEIHCQQNLYCGWSSNLSFCRSCQLFTVRRECEQNRGCIFKETCMNDSCSDYTNKKIDCVRTNNCGLSNNLCSSCDLFPLESCNGFFGCLQKDQICQTDGCSSKLTYNKCQVEYNCGWENGMCTSCNIHTNRDKCILNDGCVYEGSKCVNDLCAQIIIMVPCQSADGCGWDGQTCRSCLLIQTEKECIKRIGCQWENPYCVNDQCSVINGLMTCMNFENCGWGKKTCGSCSIFKSQQQCNVQLGCLYEEDTCHNDPCSAYQNLETCQHKKSCSWRLKYCTSCSTYSTSQSCGEQDGCIWKKGACINDECSNAKSIVQCTITEECGWNGGTCRSCKILQTSTLCNSRFGCIWDDSQCKNDSCSIFDKDTECQKVKGCGISQNSLCVSCKIQEKRSQCNMVRGCLWVNKDCVNDQCSEHKDLDQCIHGDGCGWSNGSCANCKSFLQNKDCDRQIGCLYRFRSCLNDDCGFLGNIQVCQSQDGCGWVAEYNFCHSCSLEKNGKRCNAQSGCYWVNDTFCVDDPCGRFQNYQVCALEYNCGWNESTTCVSCSTQVTSVSCNGEIGCMWDNKVCFNDDCLQIITEIECYRKQDCGWTGQQQQCLTCNNYGSSVKCGASVGCIWSTKCTNDPLSELDQQGSFIKQSLALVLFCLFLS